MTPINPAVEDMETINQTRAEEVDTETIPRTRLVVVDMASSLGEDGEDNLEDMVVMTPTQLAAVADMVAVTITNRAVDTEVTRQTPAAVVVTEVQRKAEMTHMEVETTPTIHMEVVIRAINLEAMEEAVTIKTREVMEEAATIKAREVTAETLVTTRAVRVDKVVRADSNRKESALLQTSSRTSSRGTTITNCCAPKTIVIV